MRFAALILLSIALPAHAGMEQWAKDALKNEIDRRAPVGAPVLVFDLPEKGVLRYNLNWHLSTRVGPFSYRDDLGDGKPGHFSFRPSGGIRGFNSDNMSKVFFGIRKDF